MTFILNFANSHQIVHFSKLPLFDQNFDFWQEFRFFTKFSIQVFNEHVQVWIGLSDNVNEAKFAWVDQSPINFTNWENGQPSSLTGGYSIYGRRFTPAMIKIIQNNPRISSRFAQLILQPKLVNLDQDFTIFSYEIRNMFFVFDSLLANKGA